MDFYYSKLYVPGSLKSTLVLEKLSSLFKLDMVNVPTKSNIAGSSNSSTYKYDAGSSQFGVSNYSKDCLDIMKELEDFQE